VTPPSWPHGRAAPLEERTPAQVQVRAPMPGQAQGQVQELATEPERGQVQGQVQVLAPELERGQVQGQVQELAPELVPGQVQGQVRELARGLMLRVGQWLTLEWGPRLDWPPPRAHRNDFGDSPLADGTASRRWLPYGRCVTPCLLTVARASARMESADFHASGAGAGAGDGA